MSDSKQKGKNKQKLTVVKAKQGKSVAQKPQKEYVKVPEKIAGMKASTQLATRQLLLNEDGTPTRWPCDINAPTACMQNKDVIDVYVGVPVTGSTIPDANSTLKGQFMVHNLPCMRNGIRYTHSQSVKLDTSSEGQFASAGTQPAACANGQIKWLNCPLQTNMGAVFCYPNGMQLSSAMGGFPDVGSVRPGYFIQRSVAGGATGEWVVKPTFFPDIPSTSTITIYLCLLNPAGGQWVYKQSDILRRNNDNGLGFQFNGVFAGVLQTAVAIGIQLNVEWSGQLTCEFNTLDVGGGVVNGTIELPQCTYNCIAVDRQNYGRLEADNVLLYRPTSLTSRVTNLTPKLQMGGSGDSYLIPPGNQMGYYQTLMSYIGGRYPYARVGFNADNGDYKYWLPFDSRAGLFRSLALSENQERSIIQIFTVPERASQNFRLTTVMDIEFLSDAPGYSYALASPDPDFWSAIMLLAALDNCNENPAHMETLKKAFKKVIGVASSPTTWSRLAKAATVAAGLLAV